MEAQEVTEDIITTQKATQPQVRRFKTFDKIFICSFAFFDCAAPFVAQTSLPP